MFRIHARTNHYTRALNLSRLPVVSTVKAAKIVATIYMNILLLQSIFSLVDVFDESVRISEVRPNADILPYRRMLFASMI